MFGECDSHNYEQEMSSSDDGCDLRPINNCNGGQCHWSTRLTSRHLVSLSLSLLQWICDPTHKDLSELMRFQLHLKVQWNTARQLRRLVGLFKKKQKTENTKFYTTQIKTAPFTTVLVWMVRQCHLAANNLRTMDFLMDHKIINCLKPICESGKIT